MSTNKVTPTVSVGGDVDPPDDGTIAVDETLRTSSYRNALQLPPASPTSVATWPPPSDSTLPAPTAAPAKATATAYTPHEVELDDCGCPVYDPKDSPPKDFLPPPDDRLVIELTSAELHELRKDSKNVRARYEHLMKVNFTKAPHPYPRPFLHFLETPSQSLPSTTFGLAVRERCSPQNSLLLGGRLLLES